MERAVKIRTASIILLILFLLAICAMGALCSLGGKGGYPLSTYIKVLLKDNGESGLSEETILARELIRDQGFIIHACGEIVGEDGTAYSMTNSFDALENAYSKGYRLVEVDFGFSEDDAIICYHRWSDICPNKEFSGDNRPTAEQFREYRIDGFFKSMNLEQLTDFMREHKDLYIVTDAKKHQEEFFERLSLEAGDLKDRFFVQIYSKDQYELVKELGFNKIIYTLYLLDRNERYDTSDHRLFAVDHELAAFTFEVGCLEIEGFQEGMERTGTPLAVHTVNDPKEMEKLFGVGIDSIYTDLTRDRGQSGKATKDE